MDIMLKNIAESVGKVVGLLDPETEQQEMESDRVGIGGSYNFTTVDQALVTAARMGSRQPEPLPANLDIPASLETIGERFYLIHGNDWTNSQVYLDKLVDIDLFLELNSSDFANTGNLKSHRYMQAGVDVIIQANANQFQMGCLLCMLIPGWSDGISYSGFGMVPHGFINLNINNSCRLQAPWVYTRGAYNITTAAESPWRLVIVILNELRFGNNANTGCTVSVMARYTDLRLHGMHPVGTMGPEEVRISSTNNIVNLSNRAGACARVSFALGEESYIGDDSVTGGLYVNNFRTWVCTPGYIGRFAFNGSSELTQKLAVIPVNPMFYSVTKDGHWHPHPAASISQMFAFWRGDPVYYFQTVGTRFHSGRIMIAFIPGDEAININTLTMKKATSSMCAIMDIQGTSSTCCFRIPFTSEFQYKTTVHTSTAQDLANGTRWLTTSLGKIVVFVYSKLRYPTSITGNVWINVYMCLENAELMCPMYANLGGFNSIPTTRDIELEACAGDEEAQQKFEESGAFQTPGVVDQEKSKRDFYLDKPENTIPLGATLSIEEPTMEVAKPQTFQERAPGQRRHKIDHMDIYEYMGRGHVFFSFTLNPVSGGKKVMTIPIDIRRRNAARKAMGGCLQWFFSLFHLYQGPIDITLVFSGNSNVDMLIWYTPDGFKTSRTWNQESGVSSLNADYVSGFPFIRCNTAQTSNVQVRIPWYTCLSAISACVHDSCPDTSLGNLSIYVTNYFSTDDERLGITAYLSIPKEAKMSVARPPLRQNLIYASSVGEGLGREEMPLGVIETSVDIEPETFDPRTDPLPATRLPLKHLGKVYKNLRLEVGANRLLYAREELKKAKSQENLTATAGNMFDNYAIVQMKEGDLLYRGVAHNGHIYYVRCNSPALKSVPGLKSGAMVSVTETAGWLNLNSKVEQYLFDCFLGAFEGEVRLNYRLFTNGDYVGSMGQDQFLRFDTACEGRFSELLAIFSNKSLGVLDKILMDSEVYHTVTETTKSVKELADECKSVMANMKDAIKNLAGNIAPKKKRVACKILSTIVRAGIKLFVCVRTGWRFDVAAPLFVDLAIDVTDTTCDVTGIFQSMIGEIFGDNEIRATSGDWIRNAVGCVSLFKSARDCVLWVIEKFKEWYDDNYGETKVKMDQILEAEEQIEAMLTYVDEFCSSNKTTQSDLEEARSVLSQLRTLISLVNTMPELKPHAVDLRAAVTSMHVKLRGIPMEPESGAVRNEPTVLYIHGPRGCGKSLLAMGIATKICKAHGLDPKQHIYTKAPVSDYWDGYANQCVCIMDDIGQATDDKDWTDFCQIVSCCPMRVNMANLEEKGMMFTTPYIICTSNLSDPDPRTVYTKEAITRRLHIKVKVLPNRYYVMMQNNIPVLDIKKAMSHDAIKDLSCLRLVLDDQSEITFEQLSEMYLHAATNKAALMSEFMDLWSQGSCDSLSAWMSFRKPQVVKVGAAQRLMRAINSHKCIIIGTVVITLASAALLYVAISKTSKPKAEAAYASTRVVKNVVRLGEEIQSQSVVDLANLIDKNLMRFGVSTDGETVSWRVNCLQVFDTWCIVPYHACKFDKSVSHFFFMKNGTTYVVRRDRIVEVPSETCPDLLYINVPGMPKGRNLIEHFVKQGDVPACDGRLATLATVNQGLFQIISEGVVQYKDGITYNHSSQDGKEKIFIPKIWKGQGEAAPGSCGGVLISSNARLGNPFLGIHLAAGGGVLVTALVTQEELKCLQGVLSKSTRVTHCVPSTEIVSTSNQSSFVRSVLYDVLPYPVEKSPAILFNDKRVEVDVMASMFHKYNFPLVSEPPGFSNSAFAVLDRVLDVYGMPRRCMLSEREAIVGVDGMDGIDLSTSPGIPYIFKGQRKVDLICNGEVKDQLLRDRINAHMNDMTFGIACNVVFASYAKDELRKTSKVLAGDTRLIEASPVCFSIAFRQYFGPAIAWLQSHPGWHTGVGVGLDPESQWDMIFKEAMRFGDVGIAMDYRNFDATLQPFMIYWAIYIMGYLCCVPEPVVESVVSTLTYSKRQVGRLIYYVRGSLPSGAPATSIINSLANLCVLTYSFSQTLGVSPFDLYRIVKFLTYGDDVVVVWNRNYNLEALNLPKLHEVFASLGMIVTGADKGPVSFAPILDLTFLKRGIRVGPIGVLQPCMEKSTIVSLLQWKRKKAVMEDNINDALGFAFHHGREYFEELRSAILTGLAQVGIECRVRQYEEYEQRFLALHFPYLA